MVADGPLVNPRDGTVKRHAVLTSSLQSTLPSSLLASLLLLTSCGGGGGGSSSSPGPAPAPSPAPTPAPAPAPAPSAGIRVSPPSPFAAGCNGAQVGTLFSNAEVEPTLAVNPLNANNVVASWQQDRWSNGGAQGIVDAVTFDGGASWSARAAPFSLCAGGNASNGGDFDRASNPWVAFSPNGTAHRLALTFTGTVLTAGSQSAMLVSRSTDGGLTWSATTTLIRSDAQFFNDKGSITADPNDARYVYATWDRLTSSDTGPALLARSADNGLTWSAAVPIYDPGPRSQTIGNVIAVRPDGSLVDLYTQIDFASDGTQADAFLAVIRSRDHGATWSAPTKIADLLSVGTRDPQTGAPIRDASVLGEISGDAGGNLVVVWQDARFSGGLHDGIAFARSIDGGLSWSAPVAVNGAPAAAAFLPIVSARADGVIAILYEDFRDDTTSAATLATDTWLARSADAGRTWTESRLTGPFDLDLAPRVDAGLFLGDYQALGAAPDRFVALFVATNTDAANRTDVYSTSPAFIANALLRRSSARAADEATALPTVDEVALRRRSAAAIGAAMQARWPDRRRVDPTQVDPTRP